MFVDGIHKNMWTRRKRQLVTYRTGKANDKSDIFVPQRNIKSLAISNSASLSLTTAEMLKLLDPSLYWHAQ